MFGLGWNEIFMAAVLGLLLFRGELGRSFDRLRNGD